MFCINPYDTCAFPFFKEVCLSVVGICQPVYLLLPRKWDTQFLFWSVTLGALSVAPVVIIPVLSTNGLRPKSIM